MHGGGLLSQGTKRGPRQRVTVGQPSYGYARRLCALIPPQAPPQSIRPPPPLTGRRSVWAPVLTGCNHSPPDRTVIAVCCVGSVLRPAAGLLPCPLSLPSVHTIEYSAAYMVVR